MFKSPIHFRDMQNPSVLQIVSNIMRASAVDGLGGKIIVELIGSWVEQGEYNDETGWFVVFRCTPHVVSTNKAAADILIEEFKRRLCNVNTGLGDLISVTRDSDSPESNVELMFTVGYIAVGDTV